MKLQNSSCLLNTVLGVWVPARLFLDSPTPSLVAFSFYLYFQKIFSISFQVIVRNENVLYVLFLFVFFFMTKGKPRFFLLYSLVLLGQYLFTNADVNECNEDT